MKKLKLVLFARNCTYGNAPGLFEALKYSSVVEPISLVLYQKDVYAMYQTVKPRPLICRGDRSQAGSLLSQADALWVNGAISLEKLGVFGQSKCLNSKLKAIFLSDTWFSCKHKEVMEFLTCSGFNALFAMPDLIRHAPNRLVPLYQSYPPLETLILEKPHTPLVLHSPGVRAGTPKGREKKGTDRIKSVLKKLLRSGVSFNSEFLSGLPNLECIQKKRSADIFIDKLSCRDGGLGKSGLEALSCGCPVVCSMCCSTLGDIPPPPVIPVCDEDVLYKILLKLLTRPEVRQEYRRETLKWRENISYEATASRIDAYLKKAWAL